MAVISSLVNTLSPPKELTEAIQEVTAKINDLRHESQPEKLKRKRQRVLPPAEPRTLPALLHEDYKVSVNVFVRRVSLMFLFFILSR